MDNKRKTVLLIGATSDIGYATARAYADAGWGLMLAARNVASAQRNAADLAIRVQSEVKVFELDMLKPDTFNGMLDSLPKLPDTVICVVGDLGASPEEMTEQDMSRVMRVNFEGPSLLLEHFATRMAERGRGTIVGVSSVAGDRGRAQNYVYGSAKAGFSAFLSGLRNRFFKHGVHVLTVKPGFVRTKMTANMDLPDLLTADATTVGARIFKAAEIQKKNVTYVLSAWRPIMMIIKSLPEPMFKRLNI